MVKTYFLDVLMKHYFDFEGRATRKEFWMYVLFGWIIGILLGIVCGMLGKLGMAICWIYQLAILLPSLGIAARRLHDSDKSAWWLLLNLTGIGSIVVLVFFVLPSTGANRFGSAK